MFLNTYGTAPRRLDWIGPVLLLYLAALLCFAMWFYADRVWAPSTDIHFSELDSRWYGSRELLLHRRDPYGLAVTMDAKTWLHPYPGEPTSNPAG
jgi:hypothetical protein